MQHYQVNEKFADSYYSEIRFKNFATPLNEEQLNELSTDQVTVLSAYIGDISEVLSGMLVGYAKFKTPIIVKKDEVTLETHYIKFLYNIYCKNIPESKMHSTSLEFPFDTKLFNKRAYENIVNVQVEVAARTWEDLSLMSDMEVKGICENNLAYKMFIENIHVTAKKYNWVNYIKEIQKSLEKENQ